MKRILILTIISLVSYSFGYSQNVTANVLANKYSYLLGEAGTLEVTFENTTAVPGQFVPAYKLMPTVSIGAAISNVTNIELPSGWTILDNKIETNGSRTLRLSNGTDGPTFIGGTVRTIMVYFTTSKPVADERTGVALDFSNGIAPGNIPGPPTPGNVGGDDDNPYTIYTVSSTVPVSYTQELKGVKSGSGVELSWKTGVETNNKGFAVQKSTDNGANYTTVAFVDGKGSNSSYSYTDNSPVSGVNQYRLEQLDLDGKKSLSNVVSVTFDGASGLSVYPNPATTQITVKANGLVQVYDISGKLVLSQQSVNGTAVVNISRLAKGTYVVKSGTGNAKFIKL